MNRRKLAIGGLIFVGILWLAPALEAARRELIAAIGPANSTSTVTIVAAGAGVKNCITDVDVVSQSTFTFRMLNGGTTFYSMGPLTAGASLVRSWDIDAAPCSDNNTAMQLKVDNGTFSINYNGYTR